MWRRSAAGVGSVLYPSTERPPPLFPLASAFSGTGTQAIYGSHDRADEPATRTGPRLRDVEVWLESSRLARESVSHTRGGGPLTAGYQQNVSANTLFTSGLRRWRSTGAFCRLSFPIRWCSGPSSRWGELGPPREAMEGPLLSKSPSNGFDINQK